MQKINDEIALMQRMQDAVRREYYFYNLQFLESSKLAKLPALISKFERAYDTTIGASTRSRRKAAGEAVSVGYVFYHAPAEKDAQIEQKCATVALFTTNGLGRIHALEKLSDARETRLTLHYGRFEYELIHDGKTWTWRLTRASIKILRESIERIAKKRKERRQIVGDVDIEIEKLQKVLYNELAYFRGVRRQVGELAKWLAACWLRHRPANGPQPEKRTFLPYVKRLPNRAKTAED